MKKTLMILMVIAATMFSCKKEKNEIAPAAPTVQSATYSNLTIQIGLADKTCYGWAANSFSAGTKKAVIRCNGVLLDSLVGLDTTVISGSLCTTFDPCANSSSLHLNSKAFKVQNDADNFLDIYDGGTLIATSKIILSTTPSLLPIAQNPYQGTDNYLMPMSCALLCIPER